MKTGSGKAFTAFLLVMAGSAMNATRQIQKGRSPFGVILGGLLFGTVCVGINDLSDRKFGTILAGMFLLSSVLVSGVPLMESVNGVADSYSKGN